MRVPSGEPEPAPERQSAEAGGRASDELHRDEAQSVLMHSQDEIRDMLAVIGPLPGDLFEVRYGSGIWWKAGLHDDLHGPDGGLAPGVTQAEADALLAHPTKKPSVAPLLRFPHFSVDEFIAFEDCAHVFRPAFLEQRLHVDPAVYSGPSDAYWAMKKTALGELRARNPRAAELIEALLGPRRPGGRAKYVIAQRVDAIRAELARLGLSPRDVPKTAPKTGGIKKKVRDLLQPTAMFDGKKHHFDSAWKATMDGEDRSSDSRRGAPTVGRNHP